MGFSLLYLEIGATNSYLKCPVQLSVAGLKGVVFFSLEFSHALLLLDLASYRQVKDQIYGKMQSEEEVVRQLREKQPSAGEFTEGIGG